MEESPPPQALNQALLDAVALFEYIGMRYALVGGIAAMYYGRARFTDDLDFVPDVLYEDELKRHLEQLERFHFDPTCTFKLYHESGVEVDLLYDQFADGILERAQEVELAGRKVRIAEPNDLVAMKLRAGRPQDDYDISEMIKAGVVRDELIQPRVTAEEFDRLHQLRVRSLKT
jgi:predicted nucleotidyltransferase